MLKFFHYFYFLCMYWDNSWIASTIQKSIKKIPIHDKGQKVIFKGIVHLVRKVLKWSTDQKMSVVQRGKGSTLARGDFTTSILLHSPPPPANAPCGTLLDDTITASPYMANHSGRLCELLCDWLMHCVSEQSSAAGTRGSPAPLRTSTGFKEVIWLMTGN